MIKNLGKLIRAGFQTMTEAQAGYSAIVLVGLIVFLCFI